MPIVASYRYSFGNMTTTQQDLRDYQQLFGEVGLDRTYLCPHTGVLLWPPSPPTLQ